jgi:hypothetical protein
LLIFAGFCLALAIAVYCLARSHPPEILAPFSATHSQLAAITEIFGSAPSFLYTLALGLIIGCCAAPRPSAKFHCLAWTALCVLLEISQHSNLSARVLSGLGDLLADSSLQLVSPYWARGTYDPVDLLATLAGGLLATALIVRATKEKANADC